MAKLMIDPDMFKYAQEECYARVERIQKMEKTVRMIGREFRKYQWKTKQGGKRR